MTTEKQKLAMEIRQFIEKHAGISPDYDPAFDAPEERFTGPDSGMLEAAADIFEQDGELTFYVHSTWSSGTYKANGDRESEKTAEQWHDDLVSRVNQLRVGFKPR